MHPKALAQMSQQVKSPSIDPKLQALIDYKTALEAISDWKPHAGQKPLLRDFWVNGRRQVFIQCGRKWGKTEFVVYCLWRWALTYPNSACYYLSPLKTQSREIVWASHRIQRFGNKSRVSAINDTEMRITFDNGSYIKCDGSDNWAKYDGVTVGFVVYDEFADFRPEFHTEAMGPNLAVHQAPLLIIGTPPAQEGQYTQLAREFREDPDKVWISAPTWENPYISKDWLDKEKRTLFKRGDEDIWWREYGGKFVKGGKGHVFPMLDRKIICSHSKLLQQIKRDRKKLKYFCLADPGTTTCFAVLFFALNPYTKTIYMLDEIYETDQSKTSVVKLGPRIIYKLKEFTEHMDPRKPHMFDLFRDEAAAWFEQEMFDQFGENYVFMPVPKRGMDKEKGLGAIKDSLNQDKIVMSDRCEKTYWEMENYIKDKNGKIPKENDHQIDNLRYFIEAAGYSLVDEIEPLSESLQENHRGRTISQDIDEGFYDDPDEIRDDIPW